MSEEKNAIANIPVYWHDTRYAEGEAILNINKHPAYAQLVGQGKVTVTETETFTQEGLWERSIPEAKDYIAQVDSKSILRDMRDWEAANPNYPQKNETEDGGRQGIYDLIDKREAQLE